MPSLKDLMMEMLSGRAPAPDAGDIDIGQLATGADPVPLPAAALAPPRDGMFKQSSFELLNGLEVSEEPMDTMPDELIDVFFKY